MGKNILMRGLTQNNGTWAYVRSIPKQLRGHPAFNGKKNYRRQLISTTVTDEQLFSAWKQAHDDYEQYITSLKQLNLPIIERNELIQKAELYLRVNKLKAGMLADDDSVVIDNSRMNKHAVTLMLEETGVFVELFDHGAVENYQVLQDPYCSEKELPANLQIQQQAWKLLTEPAKKYQRQCLFSDCWIAYQSKKGLDLSKREDKRIKACFDKFTSLAGDQVLTQESLNDALHNYVDSRELAREASIMKGSTPKPSPSSITRELNTLLAIFRVGIKKNRLGINVERPDIKQDHQPMQRHTFTAEEQQLLITRISDQSRNDYQPYKELMILLMIQTGTHITELLRLKRAKVKLYHDIPHIILDGELKTNQRRRVLPIVFKVERIRQLAQLFNDDSDYFFGHENVNRTADNYSSQLNKICREINNKSSTYSCRHAFKYHAHVRGIDSQTMAILGGWSGKESGLSKQMQGYAASGLLNPESLKKLQNDMEVINQHLLKTESEVSSNS